MMYNAVILLREHKKKKTFRHFPLIINDGEKSIQSTLGLTLFINICDISNHSKTSLR